MVSKTKLVLNKNLPSKTKLALNKNLLTHNVALSSRKAQANTQASISLLSKTRNPLRMNTTAAAKANVTLSKTKKKT